MINWGNILLLLLALNFALACQYSQITSIRKLTLVDVRYTERERIKLLKEDLKGVPALQIKPRKVEARFTAQSRVKSADFRRNIFGNASLTLEYRQPIAQFGKKPGVFLDSEGSIFGDPEIKPNVPVIILDPGIKVTVASLAGVINFQEIAESTASVSKGLSSVIPSPNQITLEVAETGGVSLSLRGCRVVLGTHEELKTKVDALKKLIQSRPNVLEDNFELNLMVPDRPYVKQKKKPQS